MATAYENAPVEPGGVAWVLCDATDGQRVTEPAKTVLFERAESYARDARKFADMAKLGTYPNGTEEALGFAAMYRVIADELRKVAASLSR